MTDLGQAYERLTEAIGRRSMRELGVVRAEDFQRFAYATGDRSGRSLGRDGAPAQAPSLFLSAVMGWGPGPDEDALRPDGTDPSATAGLPLDDLRLMGAGQELVLHEPVLDGDRISMSVGVEKVELKEGRSGSLILLCLRRDYLRGDGTLVLTCLETFIAR